jgi:Tfp pilus assembly protein PilN
VNDHHHVRHPSTYLEDNGRVIPSRLFLVMMLITMLVGTASVFAGFALAMLGLLFQQWQVARAEMQMETLRRLQNAKADADHRALTHIAHTADAILEKVGGGD